MTAKLLPAFLKCFEDEYVAVRSEVCITCGNIAIKDEEVISKLIHLATFDNIWKIKALAFQGKNYIALCTNWGIGNYSLTMSVNILWILNLSIQATKMFSLAWLIINQLKLLLQMIGLKT